ncbi:hypothetical protein ACH41H_37400 [Streptomyces sp. NPDC020800]|uniref:hypothetical protein n=1 Tax=Streptomyces sp. NPDC020800 TaxID=3365092 RepID=UPI0037BB27F6
MAVLAAGIAYEGFVGPAQAQQRRHEAEAARYREDPQLLYLGAAPSGMHVSHAEAGPASFVVDYRPVREGYEAGFVALTVRPPFTAAPRCPAPLAEREACTADAHGEMLTVRALSGGAQDVTLTRRYQNTEAEATSQALDEPGLAISWTPCTPCRTQSWRS